MTFDTSELSRDAGAPVELYRFAMGGLAWYYTSSEASVAFNGHTYRPETVTREAIQYGSEAASGGLVVRLPRVNPVAMLFIAGMPTQPVTLTVYRFHRSASSDVVGLPPGEIVTWDFEGALVKLACASVPQLLERRVPSLVVQTQCAWALYGPGCLVLRTTHTDPAVVAAVDGLEVTLTLATPRADSWYTAGYLETAVGRTAFISHHAGATVTLLTPLTELAVGDQVSLVAGCDHGMPTCAAKFDNVLRFMGWPGVPVTNPFMVGSR